MPYSVMSDYQLGNIVCEGDIISECDIVSEGDIISDDLYVFDIAILINILRHFLKKKLNI